MVRTLALAALLTLFGAGASQAQYRDSAPPDEQNRSEQYDNDGAPYGYDEELLGPYEEQNNNQQYDDRYSDHGYSRPDVDVGIFANLSDGRWFMTANFGWVWRPYAATSWRPYTNGRWVWTSYGWTWVSYEPFGWATYHYGYWNCDTALGWVWIPGNEWSACRVQWAYYDNYVAWAPMYPPGYACPRPFTTAGFNIWFTIGASHFCDPYPTRYCVTSYDNVYTQRVAYKSPGRTYVQQYTRTPIRESSVFFKHTKAVRGTNGFGATTRSQTVFKSKSSKSYSQPYVQNSRPNVQSKQKFNSKPSTRYSQPYVQNSRPNVQSKQKFNSKPMARDSRTFAQSSPQRQTKQQFKSSPQRKNFDTRAMQQRSPEPGYTRQYQPREAKRSVSREAMRGGQQQRSSKQFAGSGGGSQRVQREAPSRQAQRSVDRGSSKQSRGDVVKMKGGNGRGAGKH